MNKFACVIGWVVLTLCVLGMFIPGHNFAICYGPSEKCTLPKEQQP